MASNKQLSVADLAVLTILSGCPEGIPANNLYTHHQVAPATIYRLIDAGMVLPRVQTTPWTWFVITEQGRIALKPQRIERHGSGKLT
jgi:hypothetical protein